MSIVAPFGRLTTAMITPFKQDGEIDWAGVEKLAAHLVSTGHDGLVLNGTTGEAPTTSDDEKDEIIKVVRKVVGSKIKIVAGAGNNETSHSVEQAKRAAKAGADALLVVTPYYNKPPQAGIAAHFTAMADATDLPVVMYDIPGRTGIEIESDTIVKLYEHPRIVALKDAKGNVALFSTAGVGPCPSAILKKTRFAGIDAAELASLLQKRCKATDLVDRTEGTYIMPEEFISLAE